MNSQAPRVVVIGAGFAGLHVAKGLRRSPVRVTLVDRVNHHLFQPLLYQVATGNLAPSNIAIPVRRVVRGQKNADVLLGSVESVDLSARQVRTDSVTLRYDILVVACGVQTYFFGNNAFQTNSCGLKTLEDALAVRHRVLTAYEEAEFEQDPAARQAKLTFVIVGGGPTGVELAGAIIEASRLTLPNDFRHADTRATRVVLVEASDRLLPTMPAKLGRSAAEDLSRQGVEVRLNTKVTEIDDTGANLGDERVDAGAVLWAAGVKAPGWLAGLGGDTDRAGRVTVSPDLSVPNHPEVFVVGDAAHVLDSKTGEPVPGVAPAAIQMGQAVVRSIRADLAAEPRRPFRYRDKGTMAVISRGRAVAALGGLELGGFPAWMLWAFIHILSLIGFRRRVLVFLEWVWSFFFHVLGNRLIIPSRSLRLRRRGDQG